MSARASANVRKLERELNRAQLASELASVARASLPAGSSRARVTTANARWARAAEYRDLVRTKLDAARLAESVLGPKGTDAEAERAP